MPATAAISAIPSGWKLAKDNWLWRYIRKGDNLQHFNECSTGAIVGRVAYVMYPHVAKGFDNARNASN